MQSYCCLFSWVFKRKQKIKCHQKRLNKYFKNLIIVLLYFLAYFLKVIIKNSLSLILNNVVFIRNRFETSSSRSANKPTFRQTLRRTLQLYYPDRAHFALLHYRVPLRVFKNIYHLMVSTCLHIIIR